MKRITKVAALGAVAAVGLTGCSMPVTAADEIALHYGGGPLEGQEFKGCVPASSRQVNSVADRYYYYPENQRVFDFTGKDGADVEPISVVSKDNQTLTIPGSVTFDLNTNCEVLKNFHNNIGRRYQAYMVDGENGEYVTSDGWSRMMNLYIGRAADATLDRVAKQYTWMELYSNPAIKDEMNAEVNKVVAQLVNQQTDGEDEFFQNFSALIAQPQPGDALVKALEDQQTAVATAQAAEAKAVAEANSARAAADAQVAQKQAELTVAQIEAQKKAAEIAAYGGPEAYNNAKAIEKGLNPFQPIYGATIQAQ